MALILGQEMLCVGLIHLSSTGSSPDQDMMKTDTARPLLLASLQSIHVIIFNFDQGLYLWLKSLQFF